MSVTRSRLLDLYKVQCRIFGTTFNPEGQRLGTKILRERLKGPALAAYYPRRTVTQKDLQRAFPEFEMWDDKEEDRLESILLARARGKGAPKKKRTAAESKKFGYKNKRANQTA